MTHLHVTEGVVRAVEPFGRRVWAVDVDVGGEVRRAVLYEEFTARAAPGDRVALNTTAVDLGLGTGGVDFVTHVFGKARLPGSAPGHIMKLRYTPMQVRMLAVEEPASPHHAVMRSRHELDGMPVVIAELHSQLAPAAAALRLALGAEATIAYIMTDGAALPISFSRLVPSLRSRGLLDATVTVGHAVGGDLEAVTLFSGLLAARWAAGADAAIVAMGPGVVGTGTAFGTTAVEVGQHADAVGALGGRAVIAPRIGFADPRQRHVGVSHHTLTAFGTVAHRRCTIVLPKLAPEQHELIQRQLDDAGIIARHDVHAESRGEAALALLQEQGVELRSMGRGVDEEPALFLAAAAAGFVAADFAVGHGVS